MSVASRGQKLEITKQRKVIKMFLRKRAVLTYMIHVCGSKMLFFEKVDSNTMYGKLEGVYWTHLKNFAQQWQCTF